MEKTADVVIVGSGVAGAMSGARLARAGLRVLILEAGPRVRRAQALEQFYRAPVKFPESPYPNTPYAPHPGGDPGKYFLQDGPETFQSGYLRQVGGTTWHWLGTALRFLPEDFRLHSLYGAGVDWPLTYDDLEPWYYEAEKEMGVAGDPAYDLGSPRKQPYPMAAIQMSYLDQRMAAALAGIGYKVEPTPQARNSGVYQGRPPCCGSASCIPICPVQAKYDATVHVREAERAGAELVEQAVVHFVETGADGLVSGVRYMRPDRSEHRASGKVYVIASHGIESAKLLLQSRTEARPSGIANSSDQVGRNLMDHPTYLSWALAGEPVWPYRGPLSTAGVEFPRIGGDRGQRAAFRIQISGSWSWPKNTPYSTVDDLLERGLRGADLDRALAERSSREFLLTGMCEQLPLPENRVVPDFAHRDALGVPRLRITYRVDEYTRLGLEQARRVHRRIFAAMQCSEAYFGDDIHGSGHLIGTYRMGDNPRDSVVDANLRTHDHPNLFLLGSGVFPTSTASNPTLTIGALALRAVEPIRQTARK
ncbi:MAG: GMC family oxidoreductase [Bryobacteraceae bacterium]